MAQLMESYSNLKNFVFHNDRDDPVFSFPAVLSVITMYVLSVKVIGPILMENRKPFQLKNVLIGFNVFVIFWNAFVSYGAFSVLIENAVVDGFCTSKSALRRDYYFEKVFVYEWIFFLMKAVEFIDTIFFVLRKKYQQASFLHVYHHAFMFFFSWLRIATKTDLYSFLICMALNSFVHVVMYTYYALAAACGPNVRAFLATKKSYITFLQLTQFVIMIISLTLTMALGCDKVGIVNAVLIGFVVTQIILFLNFYKKSYKKTK